MLGMLRRPRALVLQARKAIPFKGLQNRIDMGPRQLEAVRNTLFVPSFRRHTDHRLAGVVGIGKGGESGKRQIPPDLVVKLKPLILLRLFCATETI